MPDEEQIKLRPRRPKFVRDESKSWSSAFKGLMRIARMTSTRQSAPAAIRPGKPHKQRCAIRVTYSPNHVRGQWAAHGRYIARESANPDGVGFNMTSDEVAIPATLASWQKSGDPRLFKMIISPEFGERLELKKHTRDVITRLSQDLNTDLEWVAVAHFNTGHPHIHVALRGVTPAGDLRLPRDVIKHTIRRHAEDLCTEQLGFRTINDAIESECREIHALHVTSLDRDIQRRLPISGSIFSELELPSGDGERNQIHLHHLTARLHTLAKLGLAESISQNRWQVVCQFRQKLTSIQRANDRLRSTGTQQSRSLVTSEKRVHR
ncbi:MAG: hypothetical protein JNM66_03735 [Bryobacterales bacterium]|nr:hypothetical protein [Bryobacterales bacterium]